MKIKGFGLFSLVIMLAIVGLILWQSLKMFESRTAAGDESQGLLAPIEAAQNAKKLIERRSLGQ